jgi:TonB-dependent starch-binding outer membrane protein SusC
MRKRILNGEHPTMKSCKSFIRRTLLLTIAAFLVICTASAQSQKITIEQNNKQLGEILNEIEAKSGYSFLVRSSDLNLKQIVSIDAKDKNINEILSILFKNKDIKYEINGKKISVFIPQKSEEKVSLPKNTKKITGQVTDEKGETIIGASVVVKGKSLGTVTDINGNFSVNDISNEDILVFSYIGLNTKEIKVGANSTLKIVLEELSVELQEVVALGYTTVIKRTSIGSFSKVTGGELRNLGNGGIASALQGRASGVYVSKGAIRIRGINSIGLSTSPLWIIDGVPGDGDGLNPNDIVSIDVLKDASATALYGSAGSNGVIVVTTNLMSKAESKMTVELTTGMSDYSTPMYPLMNTDEYFKTYDDAIITARKYNPLTKYPFNPTTLFDFNSKFPQSLKDMTVEESREYFKNTNTNWFDLMNKVGVFNNIYVAADKPFSDGGKAYMSFNYRTQDAQTVGPESTSFKGRFGFNFNPLKKLNVVFNADFNLAKSVSVRPSGNSKRPPFFPVYDDTDETGYWLPQDNPMIMSDRNYHDNYGRSSGGSAYLKATYDLPVKGLSIGGLIRANYGESSSVDWYSGVLQVISANDTRDNASQSSSNSYSFLYRAEVNYNRSFGDHNVTAFAMAEARESSGTGVSARGAALSNSWHRLGVPADMMSMSGNVWAGQSVNYIGRLAYNYGGKYLFEANYRRDGMSKLLKKNRWASFPSLGLGWIISEENFFKADAINLLKFKASIGRTGNASIGNYTYAATYNRAYPTSGWSSVYGDGIASWNTNVPADLVWETLDNLDFGFDYGLFKNRLSGSLAFYNKEVSGLILSVSLPPSTGMRQAGNKVLTNVGNMRNKGVEFDITAHAINKGDFKWNISLNISKNINEVLALTPEFDSNGTGIDGRYSKTRKGDMVGSYYLAEFAGIDPERGIPMIYEIDKVEFQTTGKTVKTGKLIPATQINANANRIFSEKSFLPNIYGGLRNSLSYKGFDLGVLLSYSGGHYFIDGELRDITSVNIGVWNLYSGLADMAWKKPGDISDYPELIYNYGPEGFYYDDQGKPSDIINQSAEMTTQFLKPGDHIILREVTLSYNFKNLKNRNALKLYFNVNNLASWALAGKYMDPEVGISGNNLDGFIRGANLMTRIFTGGLVLSF